MANFSINFGTNDELLNEVNEKFKKLTLEDESKVQALPRILNNALKFEDEITMMDNGVDLNGLNACFNAIRQQFTALSQSRAIIEKEYNEKYENLNTTYQENLNQLQDTIKKKEIESDEIKKVSVEAIKERDTAIKDVEQLTKRAESAEKRAEEQAATIDRLNAEATANRKKIDNYDDLKKQLEEANETINAVNNNLKNKENEYALKMKEMQGELDSRIHEIKSLDELHIQEKKSLNEKIQDKNEQLKKLDNRLEKADQKNDNLQEKYDEQVRINQKNSQNYQDEIKKLNEVINDLNSKNQTLENQIIELNHNKEES